MDNQGRLLTKLRAPIRDSEMPFWAKKIVIWGQNIFDILPSIALQKFFFFFFFLSSLG